MTAITNIYCDNSGVCKRVMNGRKNYYSLIVNKEIFDIKSFLWSHHRGNKLDAAERDKKNSQIEPASACTRTHQRTTANKRAHFVLFHWITPSSFLPEPISFGAIAEFFGGATGNPADTLLWLPYRLIHHLDIQAKCNQEICKVCVCDWTPRGTLIFVSLCCQCLSRFRKSGILRTWRTNVKKPYF